MLKLTKKQFIASFLTLNILDILITLKALENPIISELNAIPFSILFPIKVIMPFFIGYFLYSKCKPYTDIGVTIIILMYIGIIINNTYWLMRY
jgi:hypothetical protein